MSIRLAVIGCLLLLGCSEQPYRAAGSMAVAEQDHCNAQVAYCNPPPPQHAQQHDLFR